MRNLKNFAAFSCLTTFPSILLRYLTHATFATFSVTCKQVTLEHLHHGTIVTFLRFQTDNDKGDSSDEDEDDQDDERGGPSTPLLTVGSTQSGIGGNSQSAAAHLADTARSQTTAPLSRIELTDQTSKSQKSRLNIFPFGARRDDSEYKADEKEKESVLIKIIDRDEDEHLEKEYLYDLFWWNSKSRSKVNAFCLKRARDPDFKWQHYLYFRFDHQSDSVDPERGLKWEWYDNDKARYREYQRASVPLEYGDSINEVMGSQRSSYGERRQYVVEQLEATFQSNIQENFPVKHFHSPNNKYQSMFHFCHLTELTQFLKKQVYSSCADLFGLENVGEIFRKC